MTTERKKRLVRAAIASGINGSDVTETVANLLKDYLGLLDGKRVIVHRASWWRPENWDVCWERESCSKDTHVTAIIPAQKESK